MAYQARQQVVVLYTVMMFDVKFMEVEIITNVITITTLKERSREYKIFSLY